MWLLASLLYGCSETCAPPTSELNEHDWEVFIQAVDYEVDNPDLFPSEGTPGNGTHIWRIDWTSPELVETDPTGEVEVTVDDQLFEGRGYWSNQECGNFSITFAGEYVAEAGSRHSFAAGALLAVFPSDAEGTSRIEGFVDWDETWRAATGEIGSYTATAQLFGTQK